ncbi:PREDICTED: asparagine synthetase domain-containing protein 1 isoform X2 [Nicotiana attenuata]|uniref:asparagine synthetase domain-containing protein 1 isoform X2 n=1 Tax=Nicotiana attenuata TaxID=49451 RepID=UPI0009051677|nr:PREDICTED: asparagine synthetase domain-containing protein 1 isoform X2 [Nicotiana attenuata]
MCGTAVIVCGIRIILSSTLNPNFISPLPLPEQQTLFSVDDIKAVLRRRGPDSLGCKKILLRSGFSSLCGGEQDVFAFVKDEDSDEGEACRMGGGGGGKEFTGELQFIGATLQLRGINPIVQPLMDVSGNILVYNGEIFGGIQMSSDSNDTEILMQHLGLCYSHISSTHNEIHTSGERQSSVPELLSRIKGPWALIYWQSSSKKLWFGRDALGRRSLLVHWPTKEDPRFLLSSVSPLASVNESSDTGGIAKIDFWEELPCGIYSLSIGASGTDEELIGEVLKHDWTDPKLNELITWERTSIQPKPNDLLASRQKVHSRKEDSRLTPSILMESKLASTDCLLTSLPHRVMIALQESIMRRTSLNAIYQATSVDYTIKCNAPIAVLFSGGIDSMILAALLNKCMDAKYEIDLLNVSFDGPCAPDRISARAGVKELQKIAPSRRWKLVEIDADLLKLTSETKHVMSLINPASTYMDLNIGIALWLAASGDGLLQDETGNDDTCDHVKYKSAARILLVGSGADEQCAGYGRHRTKYRNGSWLALNDEMKLDMQRIWKRNLGRDDRCIADNGKEVSILR